MEFENCDGGDLRADGFGGETFLQADDKDGRVGQVQGSLENSPRISPQQADPFCLESKGNSFAEEGEEEKNNVDEDKTVSESAFEVTPVEGADRSEEAETRRHRIIRQDGENGAADDDPEIPRGDDGDRHGDPAEDDSFEEEPESPRTRYQRYMQSTMEEVSDVEEWKNMHYGFATPDDPLPDPDREVQMEFQQPKQCRNH
jgi:hypothetical protein